MSALLDLGDLADFYAGRPVPSAKVDELAEYIGDVLHTRGLFEVQVGDDEPRAMRAQCEEIAKRLRCALSGTFGTFENPPTITFLPAVNFQNMTAVRRLRLVPNWKQWKTHAPIVVSKSKPATARKRRYRWALQHGAGTAMVPLADLNGTIEVLLRLAWLTLEQSENRKAIGEALGRLIDDLVAAELRKREP